MTVICHTPVSAFTGQTGNPCKKWLCLVSVPWGEGDCLWVSLSVLCCLKCHCPAAARCDPGSKKRAEVLELTFLRSTSVLGEKQPLPYQVRMLFMERHCKSVMCDTWFPCLNIPVTVSPHPSGCLRLRALPNHPLWWLGGLKQRCAGRVRPLHQSPLWLLQADYRRF